MLNAIQHLFNWKKHPASVFYFAIPLFLIGMGAMGLRAYLEWKIHGDLVYSAIVIVAMIVLFIALMPAYRMHKINRRFTKNRN